MQLTKDEVKKISELCRIQLTEAELEKFQKELAVVLDYVAELQKVDTEGVEEISQVTGLTNVLREDKERLSDLRDALIERFPERKDDFLKIKSIL
ncbi:Asp-tRNA(Asn)/Glu-tRNA(Gln) amidotransferase subunit GatC [Patescibacteria group bacterium]|nr:Asp-tRNA(Asn)/Glu-tRNA(Gln) amidotransferase subunit GatC [Patescibacteria group bacterium]